MAKEIQHELTFLPDESVIKRAERVGYGKPVSTIRKVRLLTIIIRLMDIIHFFASMA